MLVDNKKTRKRQNSNEEYIDALQANHSKLCVIRLDFAYKKPYSEELSVKEAIKDHNRLMNNTRNNQTVFGGLVGHISKREYTEDKGAHIHEVLFFDGQKVQKDVFKADQIGKYYVDKITKGKGTYYNCNRNSYSEHGIGMLNHNDIEKRKNLDKALAYLSKDEQLIKVDDKKIKSIVRGTIPKSKGNVGRPRKQ